MAYVARHFHQPLSELYDLTVDEFNALARAASDDLRRQQQQSRGR